MNLIGFVCSMGMVLCTTAAAVNQDIQRPVIVPEQKTEYEKTLEYIPTEPTVTVEQGTLENPLGQYTSEEAKEIKAVAMLEAGNQGEDGMWLVMSVVVNRKEDPLWPDTIHGVIYQKYAFSSLLKKSTDDVTEYSDECERAFERICLGEVAPQIIGFETVSSDELDKYFSEAFVYRNHKFYTKK